MMNELIEQKTEAVKKTDQMITIIEKAVMSPDVDVDKLERLLAMQKEIMKENAKIAFNLSMANLQPILPTIHKSSKAHNSTYAKYEDIDKKVRPLYTSHGFSISFTSKTINGQTFYYAELSHVDGHSKTAEIDLVNDTGGSKNPVQAKGSSISYAKRYLICMLLNIVTTNEDDDALSLTYSITDEQAEEIKALLRETESDVKGFLKYIGAKTVDDIQSSLYGKAMAALKTKAKVKKNDNS